MKCSRLVLWLLDIDSLIVDCKLEKRANYIESFSELTLTRNFWAQQTNDCATTVSFKGSTQYPLSYESASWKVELSALGKVSDIALYLLYQRIEVA